MGCLCRVPSNVCNTCDSIENHNRIYRKDSSVNINDDYVDMASSWHEAGANIIGGCCRVTPGTISRLRQKFKN
jgi:S-methylmethionine-dependent homocysteine/selenocysteine methylase